MREMQTATQKEGRAISGTKGTIVAFTLIALEFMMKQQFTAECKNETKEIEKNKKK